MGLKEAGSWGMTMRWCCHDDDVSVPGSYSRTVRTRRRLQLNARMCSRPMAGGGAGGRQWMPCSALVVALRCRHHGSGRMYRMELPLRVRQPGVLAWLEGAPARVDNRSINRLAASLDGGGSLIIDLLFTYYSLIIHLFALSVGMSNWS